MPNLRVASVIPSCNCLSFLSLHANFNSAKGISQFPVHFVPRGINKVVTLEQKTEQLRKVFQILRPVSVVILTSRNVFQSTGGISLVMVILM
jgi:hypothetical protein